MILDLSLANVNILTTPTPTKQKDFVTHILYFLYVAYSILSKNNLGRKRRHQLQWVCVADDQVSGLRNFGIWLFNIFSPREFKDSDIEEEVVIQTKSYTFRYSF